MEIKVVARTLNPHSGLVKNTPVCRLLQKVLPTSLCAMIVYTPHIFTGSLVRLTCFMVVKMTLAVNAPLATPLATSSCASLSRSPRGTFVLPTGRPEIHCLPSDNLFNGTFCAESLCSVMSCGVLLPTILLSFVQVSSKWHFGRVLWDSLGVHIHHTQPSHTAAPLPQ